MSSYAPKITSEQIERLRTVQATLPEDKKRELTELLGIYLKESTKNKAKDDFISFIKRRGLQITGFFTESIQSRIDHNFAHPNA